MLPIPIRGRDLLEDPAASIRRELERFIRGPWFRDVPGTDITDITDAYPLDVYEDENAVYVDAELPGFRREEIQVNLDDGLLTIRAEREAKKVEGKRHLTERWFTRVQRSIRVPSTVDETDVKANLEDGVLHLKMHKAEESKTHRIEIS